MLYLMPPFHIINGVSLFRDHADETQWYFLPLAPKLSILTDPATRQRIPQFQLIKYRGRAGNGGFLNLDVNIGVDQDVLDDVKTELKRLENLRSTPRLAAVPIVDGTVRMLLLGRQSGDTAPDGPGPRFVVKIDQSAKPALYGDNQAAFSVQLTQEGVAALEPALRGEMSPIGIVYSLQYHALRPAYSVRLFIDWDRVQKHMNENFSTTVLFSSTEIDKTVDELVDKRMIILEADTFIPEGEDSGVITRRDQAMNEVRDMITNAFFEPSLDPIKEAKDGWDKAEHLAQRVSTIAVTGGWGAIASFSYKKVDYTRIDRKTLNVNMSERTTVQRTIYPQGHLSGIFRTLRQQGLNLDDYIIAADLDHPWFERRRVRVASRANFQQDSIGSLSVTLRYGNQPKTVLLKTSDTETEVDWPSTLVDGAMKREVSMNYKVGFSGVDNTERPLSLTSPEQTITGDIVEIDPRELYAIVSVPVLVPEPTIFPWKEYPQVEVQTRYTDEANGIQMSDVFRLTEKQPSQTWLMFVRDPQKTRFQYKLIFRGAGRKNVEKPWVDTDGEEVAVDDPFPSKLGVTVVPVFDWTEVERAFVDVVYEDKANRVRETQGFQFTQDDHEPKLFSVSLRNPDLRLVTYEGKVVNTNGTLDDIPKSTTRDDRIFARKDMQGHKVVLVHPAADNFAKKKLKSMKVELKYDDADGGMSAADIFEFLSPDEQAYFEFDYADAHKASYDWRVTYRYTNAQPPRTTAWKKANVDDLAVPLG